MDFYVTSCFGYQGLHYPSNSWSYIQAVGYNSIEAEDWEVATSGEEMSKMESLLLDKNRKMEHELTQLKVWSLIYSNEASDAIRNIFKKLMMSRINQLT